MKDYSFIGDYASKLPLNFESDDFETNISVLFYEYLSVCENYNIEEVERVEVLITGILSSIKSTYEGLPYKAYDILKKAFDDSNITEIAKKNFPLKPETNLFRIRKEGFEKRLDKKDLFHIPFESRGRCSTQRFSIPGFPALYVSNSLYVSWKEMGMFEFNYLHAARLSNIRSLNVLDLTYEPDDMSESHYAVLWPLIAACAVKVRNRSDNFKSEYIIPQLLMQWVNKEKVDGIMYSSTHLFNNNLNNRGRFYNIVFPSREVKTKGHCAKLAAAFLITEPISYYERSIVPNFSRLTSEPTILTNVNTDISEIEIFKNVRQQYHETIFGSLEHTLLHLPLSSL
ncbi:RES domain-containing protein [Sphingobacterium faecium]